MQASEGPSPPACSHPHLPVLCSQKQGLCKNEGGSAVKQLRCTSLPGAALQRGRALAHGPEQLTAREGFQSQGHRPAVPSVRWDSRVMASRRVAPEAWEVGHLCSSRPPPLSCFSMLGQGVLLGTTNPAAPHEKTFCWPEVPSSRSAQHQSHGD